MEQNIIYIFLHRLLASGFANEFFKYFFLFFKFKNPKTKRKWDHFRISNTEIFAIGFNSLLIIKKRKLVNK